jgi:hypothetical protein
MAMIAIDTASRAIEGRDAKHEMAMFAVFETAKMLKKLKLIIWSCGTARSGSTNEAPAPIGAGGATGWLASHRRRDNAELISSAHNLGQF